MAGLRPWRRMSRRQATGSGSWLTRMTSPPRSSNRISQRRSRPAKCRLRQNSIRVSVQRSPQSIRLVSPEDVIQVWIDGVDCINKVRNDFAAWYFLPIAMRTGRDLQIEGEGSEETIRNARRISEIWETWLPHHFTAVNVSFDTVSPRRAADGHRRRSLCCYSGGIDSTHALLTRHRAGETQSLLTLHGMDYRLEDKEKFEAFKDKIAPFSRLVGDGHIFLSTDAHASYRTRRVNKWGHFSHIFVLAGSGFLFSEEYGEILIAADYRLDQQFIAHPWGSNGATNIYFDDGYTRLSDARRQSEPDREDGDAADFERSTTVGLVLQQLPLAAQQLRTLPEMHADQGDVLRGDGIGAGDLCGAVHSTKLVSPLRPDEAVPGGLSPGHHQLREAHRQTGAAAERGRRLRDGEART